MGSNGSKVLRSAAGVLWDMDGVIVDTGDYHYRAWTHVLAAAGVVFSQEQFRASFGMNNIGILTMLFGRAPTAAEIEVMDVGKEQYFRELIREDIRPLPGVSTWLASLHEAGVRQAIASSAPPESIDFFVDALDLGAWLDARISGTDMPGKPAPDVFLTAARAIDMPPERCVVIEDAIPGVQAARRAGMKCIAVTTTNPAERLTAADVVVASLAELAPDTIWRLLDSGPSLSPQVGPLVSPQVGPLVSPQAGPSVSPQVGPLVSPQVGPSVSPQVGPLSCA